MLLDLSDVLPYPLNVSDGKVSYTFTTDNGIEYLIAFDDKTSIYSRDDIGESVVFEYQFFPTSNVDSEIHDVRIIATVMDSIIKATANFNNVILYIC